MQPMTESLRAKVEEEDLDGVLNDPSCFRAYNANADTLVTFFRDRMIDLLTLALSTSEEDHTLSTKALQIIVSGRELPGDILAQDLLANRAPDILKEKNPLQLNRFAMITQSCALCAPNLVHDKCAYLKLMIPLIGHRCVYEMFASFMKHDDKTPRSEDKCISVCQALKEDGFLEAYLEALQSLPAQLTEEEIATASALFKLAPLIRGMAPFDSAFLTENSMTILMRKFENPPLPLLSDQWKAINKVLCDENKKFLIPHVREMVEMIDIGDGKRFSSPQLSVLEVLQRLLQIENNAGVCAAMVEGKLPEKLVAIVRTFRRHTLAHRYVTMLALGIHNVGSEELARPVLTGLMKVAAEFLADEESRTEEIAFAWKFLHDLKEQGEAKLGQKLFEEQGDEVAAAMEKVSDMDTVAAEEYGGPLPEENGADQLSQEQLIALLRYITSGSR